MQLELAYLRHNRAPVTWIPMDLVPAKLLNMPAAAPHFGLGGSALGFVAAREDNSERAPFAALRFKLQAGVQELA
jgi:hypothetical protein